MMQEYRNKVITGDTLEVLSSLPSGVVDVGVTSPPYNKGENKKGWLVKNVKYNAASDKKTEAGYQEEQVSVLNEVYRVTKPGGSFFYNHKLRRERGVVTHPIEWVSKTEWVLRQEIIWDRSIAANIRGWWFWQVDERIYWLYKPIDGNNIGRELESRHAKMTSVWKITPEGKNPHPAPFPIVLPARVIYSILSDSEGGLVLDPYSGSGTTLAAAKILGHDYLGIDVSAEYNKLAKERLLNYKSETKYVENEKILHKINKTFKDRKKAGLWSDKVVDDDATTLLDFIK